MQVLWAEHGFLRHIRRKTGMSGRTSSLRANRQANQIPCTLSFTVQPDEASNEVLQHNDEVLWQCLCGV